MMLPPRSPKGLFQRGQAYKGTAQGSLDSHRVMIGLCKDCILCSVGCSLGIPWWRCCFVYIWLYLSVSCLQIVTMAKNMCCTWLCSMTCPKGPLVRISTHSCHSWQHWPDWSRRPPSLHRHLRRDFGVVAPSPDQVAEIQEIQVVRVCLMVFLCNQCWRLRKSALCPCICVRMQVLEEIERDLLGWDKQQVLTSCQVFRLSYQGY